MRKKLNKVCEDCGQMMFGVYSQTRFCFSCKIKREQNYFSSRNEVKRQIIREIQKLGRELTL